MVRLGPPAAAGGVLLPLTVLVGELAVVVPTGELSVTVDEVLAAPEGPDPTEGAGEQPVTVDAVATRIIPAAAGPSVERDRRRGWSRATPRQ